MSIDRKATGKLLRNTLSLCNTHTHSHNQKHTGHNDYDLLISRHLQSVLFAQKQTECMLVVLHLNKPLSRIIFKRIA